MSGFFTSSFLNTFPYKVLKAYSSEYSGYLEILNVTQKGTFRVFVNTNTFLALLENIKSEHNDLYKLLTSLHASSKIKSIKVDESIIPPLVETMRGIRKSIAKEINTGISCSCDSILVDKFENIACRENITRITGIPIFLESDIESKEIDYLFKEQSFYHVIGSDFSWARFLNDYTLPFTKIRILDPYLYVNIEHIDFTSILRTLCKKSNNTVNVQIISDINASRKYPKSEILEKVNSILRDVNVLNVHVELFMQNSSASKLFHKRVIWTDFWSLLMDRGFDFIKYDNGRFFTANENTLFMSGKYATNTSSWSQINNQWNSYLNSSSPLNIL